MIEILDFYMDNCAPCKQIKPILESFENVKFINAMNDSELTKKYNIRKAPTIIFLREGEEIDRFSGFKTKEEIQEILNIL